MVSINIEERLAQRARGREPSPIRALFPLLSVPGMISFGGGYPNPTTFPFSGMDLHFHGGKQISISGAEMNPALQDGPSDSDPSLFQHLRDWHQTKDGIELSHDSLVVLNGAQEGLFIAGYVFLDPVDTVVVSEPTYPGALSAFSPFTQNCISIPLDDQGMQTAELEATLEKRVQAGECMPTLIYTIPHGHNPGGVALARERRTHLMRIASRFDLLILEDDPYQLVRLHDSPALPTLQSMDTEGRVIRLDSFSKVFAPGLRVGYASGRPEIIQHFVLFKQSANLHTSSLAQHVLRAYLSVVTPQEFLYEIKGKCRHYRANRDEMVAAAKALLPAEVEFNTPGEGLFIWFRLPDYCQAARMVATDSRELKVLLVPGPAFSAQGGCISCMRASFSMVGGGAIAEGMTRFAEMIRREKMRSDPAPA